MNHLYGVQRIQHIFINYEFVRVVVNLEMKGYRYLRRSKHQKKTQTLTFLHLGKADEMNRN